MKLVPTGLRSVLESCVAAVRPAVTAPSDVVLMWGDGVPETVRLSDALDLADFIFCLVGIDLIWILVGIASLLPRMASLYGHVLRR